MKSTTLRMEILEDRTVLSSGRGHEQILSLVKAEDSPMVHSHTVETERTEARRPAVDSVSPSPAMPPVTDSPVVYSPAIEPERVELSYTVAQPLTVEVERIEAASPPQTVDSVSSSPALTPVSLPTSTAGLSEVQMVELFKTLGISKLPDNSSLFLSGPGYPLKPEAIALLNEQLAMQAAAPGTVVAPLSNSTVAVAPVLVIGISSAPESNASTSAATQVASDPGSTAPAAPMVLLGSPVTPTAVDSASAPVLAPVASTTTPVISETSTAVSTPVIPEAPPSALPAVSVIQETPSTAGAITRAVFTPASIVQETTTTSAPVTHAESAMTVADHGTGAVLQARANVSIGQGEALVGANVTQDSHVVQTGAGIQAVLFPADHNPVGVAAQDQWQASTAGSPPMVDVGRQITPTSVALLDGASSVSTEDRAFLTELSIGVIDSPDRVPEIDGFFADSAVDLALPSAGEAGSALHVSQNLPQNRGVERVPEEAGSMVWEKIWTPAILASVVGLCALQTQQPRRERKWLAS